MKVQFVLICFALISTCSFTQEINHYSTVLDVLDSSYTRIAYDNDIFRGTDRFYTQGVGIDVFSWKLRKNPLNALLVRLKNSDRDRFGIEFRTHGCTPITILSDSVLIGDRPYSGVFSLGVVRTSQQKNRMLRMTSQLELGMIGPAALGEETQTGIHKLTGSDIPLGWQHQIKNAPILNYTLRIEKGTPLRIPKFLSSDVYAQVKAGTFQSNFSAGLDLNLGRLNTPFSTLNHRYSFYLYCQSSVTLVGYDASLMGGIINRDGYHLTYSEINPIVLKQHVGLVFSAPHFSLAFDLAFISKEIRAGFPHSWGGVRLTIY